MDTRSQRLELDNLSRRQSLGIRVTNAYDDAMDLTHRVFAPPVRTGLTHTGVHPSLNLCGLSTQMTDHGIYVSASPAGQVAPTATTLSIPSLVLGVVIGAGLGYALLKRGV